MGSKQSDPKEQVELERLFRDNKLRIEGTPTFMLRVWAKDTPCKFTWTAQEGFCRLCFHYGDNMYTSTGDNRECYYSEWAYINYRAMWRADDMDMHYDCLVKLKRIRQIMDRAARMKVASWALQLWQLPCDVRYEVARFAYCVAKGYMWDISEV